MKATLEQVENEAADYFRRVIDGETIVVYRGQRPVAEIRPVTETEMLRPVGLAAGEFVVPDDFDDPLPDELLDAFEARRGCSSTRTRSSGTYSDTEYLNRVQTKIWEESSMNSRDLAKYLVLGGVIAGLSAGTNLRADQAKSAAVSFNKISIQMAADGNGGVGTKAPDKHACKGLNSCKSHGNCKGGDNGCAGKNSCKGKGGCASKEYKHDCAGKNACKGQGQGGKNDCKGKGSCATPEKGRGSPGKGEGTHGKGSGSPGAE